MSSKRRRAKTGVSAARLAALRVLEAWDRNGGRADRLLLEACGGLDDRDRRFTHELVLGVLRWRGRLDHLLDQLLTRPARKLSPGVRSILRLGLYQLGEEFRAPAHAVVSESVTLCRVSGSAWATGLVNATLRRYIRERERLAATMQGDTPAAMARRLSWPIWMVATLGRVLDPDALAPFLQASNLAPPLTLRVHTEHVSRTDFLEALKAHGLDAVPGRLAPAAVVIRDRVPVTTLPGYRHGWFSVQDEASQIVGLAVSAKTGSQVLDACAAPGGKALHLAEQVGASGTVFATDASADRLALLEESARRACPGRIHTAPHTWAGDPGRGQVNDPEPASPSLEHALPLPDLWPKTFDRVLVDAPCSGLGVVRRHPEIKWRRRQDDLPRYARRQQAILTHAARAVRSTGALVYSVCTMTEQETTGVVRAFLAANPDFHLEDLRHVLPPALGHLVGNDGCVRTFPHRDGCDAFFIARFRRSPDASGGEQ